MKPVTPPVLAAAIGTFALLVAGAFLSRADLALLALPLAGWTATALRRSEPAVPVVTDGADDDGTVTAVLDVTSAAEMVQLSILTLGDARFELAVPGHGKPVRVQNQLFHSGPQRLTRAIARGLDHDGARAGAATAAIETMWNAAPAAAPVSSIPHARRLPGLHGSHHGARLGSGGEFRDLHTFVPGDSVRRIDWRATARSGGLDAGDVVVRRTHTLSDTVHAIIIDTADDLSGVVALWSSTDVERLGETSLDRARSAARSFAEAAIAAGDRVSYRALAMHGQAVRPGGGRRHLARVLAAIAATQRRGEEERFERTPAVPPAATIIVLSTFFDGDASRLALEWAAAGHRVLAVDVLPPVDVQRLTAAQRFAADIVFAERDAVRRRLSAAGVQSVTWDAAGLDLAVLSYRGRA